MNELEEEYQASDLLAKSKRFFKNDPSSSSSNNKGLIAESYDWDEEEVSSDENDVTKVKALMAFNDEERVSVGKESARNSEWIKISMKKVHTLIEIKDNDDRKSFLDYPCIDLNYVEEQRNNLMSKHRNLVQELNTCKKQLLVFKQAKLDLLTMQHVNTEILKENQNLRNELKELTSITEAWLNSSNKAKDLVFVKSSADNSEVSITGSFKPKLSEVEDSTMSNHDTGKSVASLFSTREVDWIISLRRGIKPRNPQHVTKNCETCGSNVHSTSDHNDIEWLRKKESLQAKKDESFKASAEGMYGNNSIYTTEGYDYGPVLNAKAVNESQYREKSTSDACQLLEGKLVC
uniref:Retrovirus-related Pol polyprotein from transposon TNT 1-94 n=1 Tax=Tanacetum cinerariifolium TaxID=118510 RepID=A0A6L2MZF9_TANCI|nr:hypothetical protein [Tanacetum cinerariifolium]